jgi:formimidoylglutamate deiminase
LEIAEHKRDEPTAWLPDLIYTGGRFERGLALVTNGAGRIERIAPASEERVRTVRLAGRALLPGLVNAHSHAFQRVLRGRTERRTRERDSFWTWREMMYSAAKRLTPEDLYDASRMAFLEMALAGITAVGEFHYLHHSPSGEPYAEANLLAKQVVRAARDVGLRIALLRVAYARSGYRKEPDPAQARFIETDTEEYLHRLVQLDQDLRAQDEGTRSSWCGIALHSVRALPLEYLRRVSLFTKGEGREFPVHMHVAEQPAEIEACLEEHGLTPVRLLSEIGLLSERLTAVHAIHLTDEEARLMVQSRAGVCVCPTTERNLGDGIFRHGRLFLDGPHALSLGTDSQAQIDLLEDARELELNLRLRNMERTILAPAQDESASALAARLFACATTGGAQSIGAPSGELVPGRAADFFTVALDDASIAGAGLEDLLAGLVFSLSRTAIREVVVGGRAIVEAGRHRAQEETVARFRELQERLWGA